MGIVHTPTYGILAKLTKGSPIAVLEVIASKSSTPVTISYDAEHAAHELVAQAKVLWSKIELADIALPMLSIDEHGQRLLLTSRYEDASAEILRQIVKSADLSVSVNVVELPAGAPFGSANRGGVRTQGGERVCMSAFSIHRPTDPGIKRVLSAAHCPNLDAWYRWSSYTIGGTGTTSFRQGDGYRDFQWYVLSAGAPYPDYFGSSTDPINVIWATAVADRLSK